LEQSKPALSATIASLFQTPSPVPPIGPPFKELVEFCDDHRIKVFNDSSKDEEFIRTIGLWCVKNNKIAIIHEKHDNIIVFQKDKFTHEEYSMIEV
jgi:2-hydroxy-3-keto-5-methylthiopentenyl-1-phosphate phosphatase